MIELNVHGLSKLHDQLLKLGASVAEDELHKSLMNASLPCFKLAKNAAPGSIKQAVQRRRHRGKKSRRLIVKGNVANGTSAAGISIIINAKKAPHGHLVELGTKERFTLGEAKKGKNKGVKKRYPAGVSRGVMPARNFMKKAWDAQGGEVALNRFQAFLKKRIMVLTR